MEIISLIQSKPVLIGAHLGLAILGIDLFVWLFGKIKDNNGSAKTRVRTALLGASAFLGSWLVGGYYYVVYYGSLVKPIIKAGASPWAHGIIMEAKEHLFLFIVPLALVVVALLWLDGDIFSSLKLRRQMLFLVGTIIGLGFLIGAMGFTISAAARWGL